MLDLVPAPSETRFAALRRVLLASKLSQSEIFEAGEQIAAIAAVPSPDMPVMRIAVLGSLTIDFLARAIAVGAVLEGVLPEIYQAPFGSYVQEVLDPSSGLYKFRPDMVVLAPDWRDVVDELPIGSSGDSVAEATRGKVDLFRMLWDRIASLGCRIVQHTLPVPPRAFGGVAERLAPASPYRQIRAIDDGLLEAGRGRIAWVDMERLAAEVGTRALAPAKFFYGARLGIENRHIPAYLLAFRGAFRLALGKCKKVLALDLDNTLWGGVIGDDGLEGLQLGAGSPAGEAFAEWQRYAKALRDRGVILAACSKNDPSIAATGFDHSASVLTRDDFAAFECSWNDKVQGLRNIARKLNVSIDSIVFCDDNPVECDLIQTELPEVAVVHLGIDPTRFIDVLDAGHWFDLAPYTQEDLGRGQMYAARARALDEAEAAPDINAYLRSLHMKGRLWRPEEPDFERVAQLEMKTNQFNLTTRRYSPDQLRAWLLREDAVVLAFRLSDRFGDHGLTSTLVAVQEGDKLRIDSWLMSCRIFSRSAEQFIMRGLLEIAAARGATSIVGEYRPTPRNGVVAGLYAGLGFTQIGDTEFWERAVGAPDLTGIETAITAV